MSKYDKYSTTDQVYEYIKDYFFEHGYAPSIREIGTAVELKSTSSVFYHIKKLLNDGLLFNDGKKGDARSFSLSGYEFIKEKKNNQKESVITTKIGSQRLTQKRNGKYVPQNDTAIANDECIEKLGYIEDMEEIIKKYENKTIIQILQQYVNDIYYHHLDENIRIKIKAFDNNNIIHEKNWKDSGDFLRYAKENEDDCFFEMKIKQLQLCKKQYTTKALSSLGIITVKDFVLWCATLPYIKEDMKYDNLEQCIQKATTMNAKSQSNYRILKKKDQYYINEYPNTVKVFHDRIKYMVQGYDFAACIDERGIYLF